MNQNNVPMDVEKDCQYFQDIWESKSKNRVFHTADKWNERAKNWAVELNENAAFQESMTQRVMATVEYLQKRGVLSKESSVIDIGCGPGRFVSEFAKLCDYVVATDISSEMLALAAEHAKEQQQSNVDCIECDFQTTSIADQGWQKRFDLVFTSITPAISTMDCLEKMLQMSRGWIFNSSFLYQYDSIETEIASQIFSESVPPQRAHSHWFYALLNIVWLKGYYPILDYFDHKRIEKMEGNELLINYYTRLFDHYELANKEEKIAEFLRLKTDENGLVERETQKRYGWILWNVNEQVERV